ncbi:hypothetical protein DDR33_07290 [Pararcticibacter amylolyticus]|uniref:Potassium channel domain-containing protein n=1 Tax=Pararcticibacter amylolyticus TaxID=2173175 RepID=A0A2U2PIU3_9SPHI|nr:hypothetical protein DDR33_07290 [Pararcticibacter amylolyticus]
MSLYCYFYFILYSLEQTAKLDSKQKSYPWFLLKFMVIFIYLILVFTFQNWFIYELDRENFEFSEDHLDIFKLAFYFFYYSYLTITNIGTDEIVANSVIAKCYYMFGTFLGFSYLVLFLGGLAEIRSFLKSGQRYINTNTED